MITSMYDKVILFALWRGLIVSGILIVFAEEADKWLAKSLLKFNDNLIVWPKK